MLPLTIQRHGPEGLSLHRCLHCQIASHMFAGQVSRLHTLVPEDHTA